MLFAHPVSDRDSKRGIRVRRRELGGEEAGEAGEDNGLQRKKHQNIITRNLHLLPRPRAPGKSQQA